LNDNSRKDILNLTYIFYDGNDQKEYNAINEIDQGESPQQELISESRKLIYEKPIIDSMV
jgi:hypothetical protein